MTIILGSSGRLGSAICAVENEARCPARSVYETWHKPDSVERIESYLDGDQSDTKRIFVCAGILDPGQGTDELEKVNFLIPRNVITAAKESGWTVVTFGTILETSAVDNPYVRSKRLLARFIQNSRFEHVTHIRLHTLYGGGPPSPNMFLGQMLSALSNDAPFAMTSGRQVREYHHVEDEARAIQTILQSSCEQIVNLDSGVSVTLAELATAVFATQARIDLLEIGALADPQAERFGTKYTRRADLAELNFRDPLKAVPDYINELLEVTSCQR